MAIASNPLMSAVQPAATSTLQTPAPDPAGLQRLGDVLSRRFTEYEQDRRLAELKWARNSRQYLGIYDPDVERNMDPNRSRAYPKITRVKCVSMLSRLMNLLFQADDKNWGVGPSAVPNLDQEDLQQVLNTLMPAPAPGGMPAPMPSDDVIEQAIREFAKKRALRLETEIVDQLQELGGSRTEGYVSLCRKVLASGIQYGAGILKGPFIEEQKQRKWAQDGAGALVATEVVAYRPRFEWVSIWDYYPDMSAKTRNQMDGQFQRHVLSRHQLNALKARPDFFSDQIEEAMRRNPNGNYIRKAYETELRAQGVQSNSSGATRNKYDIIMWEGFVSGKELAAAGLNVAENQMEDDLRAQVWVLGGVVIKAELDPWTTLDTDGDMQQFHIFVFEEDETFLLGNGLPNIVRDSQMGVCAATRMTLDNGSVQRVFEMNTSLLSPNQDVTAINPDKIFYRDDDSPNTVQYPAIRTVELPMKLPEYQGLVRMFQEFADQETFVSAATGGDMQKGPSEPFRTATGASMIRGEAALPFKDVVRNFDAFTVSVIGAIITFNRNFNPDPKMRGDFTPIARGATSLIAKEVLGTQLDNFAATLTDGEKVYVKMRNLVRERARVRDMQVGDIVMDDAACDAVDAQQAQAAQEAKQQQDEMIKAQVREILSSTLKNLAQAGKNTASAEATTANVMLDALEKGIGAGAAPAEPPEPMAPDGGMMAEPIAPDGGMMAEPAAPVEFANGGIVTADMAAASHEAYLAKVRPWDAAELAFREGRGPAPGPKPLDTRVTESSPLASGYGILRRYENGGMVKGPGRGDVVPALLTPKEAVLPVDTVEAVGEGNIKRLIAATHTPT